MGFFFFFGREKESSFFEGFFWGFEEEELQVVKTLSNENKDQIFERKGD